MDLPRDDYTYDDMRVGMNLELLEHRSMMADMNCLFRIAHLLPRACRGRNSVCLLILQIMAYEPISKIVQG